MTILNLPPCKFKIKSSENKRFIFDNLRKKYIVLTPEEIIKKLKLAWHKKQEEQKNYEIFKSRYGIVIQNAKT